MGRAGRDDTDCLFLIAMALEKVSERSGLVIGRVFFNPLPVHIQSQYEAFAISS